MGEAHSFRLFNFHSQAEKANAEALSYLLYNIASGR